MATWKMSMEDDEVFTQAATPVEAHKKLCESFGEIPFNLVTIVEVDSVPEGGDSI